MLMKLLNPLSTRLFVGSAMVTLGAAAVYNALWFMFQPGIDVSPQRFELLLWIWQVSVLILLTGLLILPPGRGRAICWSGFVVFVIATLIHVVLQGWQFDERILWW